MKARGSCLVVLLYVVGILAKHSEDSTSVESLGSTSDTSLGAKRSRLAKCKARKTAPLYGEVSGLATSTAASGTTTVIVHITQSSHTKESMPTTTATPAASQADPSHLMFNSTSSLAVIANDTKVDSENSSGGATNASFGMPSSALYPIRTYEVPYAYSENNTSYMNATVTTGHGLEFLISTWSSAGTMYTSNLGVLLPTEPLSSILGISPNATSASRSSATRRTLGDSEQARTTTVFVNSTRTVNVKAVVISTTTSMGASVESDTQTSLVSPTPARLASRCAKILFQPKPFAELRSYLQRASPGKTYQTSDMAKKKEKENDLPRNSVTNAAPARLAPAIPAVAVVALAVMLVSGLSSFNTISSSSTVASKVSSRETTVFTDGGPAPLHILNSILTPSHPAPSETTRSPCPQRAAVDETGDGDSDSSTSYYGTRRPAFGVALASRIPAEPSNPASSTCIEDVSAPASTETLGQPTMDLEAGVADELSPPQKREEPQALLKLQPDPRAAAGACSSTSTTSRASRATPSSSPVAFVVGLLFLMTMTMMMLSSTVRVSASETHIEETYALSSGSSIVPPPPTTERRTTTRTDAAPASAAVGEEEHAHSEDVQHAPSDIAAIARSTLANGMIETSSSSSSSSSISAAQQLLERRGACAASFPYHCTSGAAPSPLRRVGTSISAAGGLAVAVTLGVFGVFGVFGGGSR